VKLRTSDTNNYYMYNTLQNNLFMTLTNLPTNFNFKQNQHNLTYNRWSDTSHHITLTTLHLTDDLFMTNKPTKKLYLQTEPAPTWLTTDGLKLTTVIWHQQSLIPYKFMTYSWPRQTSQQTLHYFVTSNRTSTNCNNIWNKQLLTHNKWLFHDLNKPTNKL